jgi:hypothetical protein
VRLPRANGLVSERDIISLRNLPVSLVSLEDEDTDPPFLSPVVGQRHSPFQVLGIVLVYFSKLKVRDGHVILRLCDDCHHDVSTNYI